MMVTTKPKLSVNINKFATLRNSRGHDNPNVLQAALDAIGFGAHGITVHPRPDERHIRRTDVYDIARALKDHPEIEFNIEGYPSEDFLAMVCEVAPHQCTLVPDPPEALTSNAGWQVAPTARCWARPPPGCAPPRCGSPSSSTRTRPLRMSCGS